jgi:hypothetical protein
MLSGHFFSTLTIQETYSTRGRGSSTLFGWGIAETEVDHFRQLVTLEDAGTYITKLPKAEHTAAEPPHIPPKLKTACTSKHATLMSG